MSGMLKLQSTETVGQNRLMSKGLAQEMYLQPWPQITAIFFKRDINKKVEKGICFHLQCLNGIVKVHY